MTSEIMEYVIFFTIAIILGFEEAVALAVCDLSYSGLDTLMLFVLMMASIVMLYIALNSAIPATPEW